MKNRHSRSEHLAALAEISGAFASTLNIEETLNHGLTRIREFMGVEAVSIFLTDTATGELVCRACAGGTDITGVRMQPGQGIVGEAAEADQPLMVRDVYDDARFSPVVDEMTGFVSRSIMAAPLVVDTLRLGAIEVVNPSGGDGLFQESDRATLSLLATAVALSINNARLAAELVDQARIRHELALASEIQKELLPRSPGELFPVHALNYPAHEVSGDLYDFQQLPDGGIAFCLADVSGKGINAALLGMKVSTLIHHLARECDDPAKLLTRVNDVLVEGRRRGMFVTALAGYLSADQRQVRLANAGHPPPVLRRGLEARAVTAASGPPLGVVQDLVYETESHAI
ncbi:MAG: PP2C family protein-serine/threonine phosphatase, partial [Gammaproteobacteria bacterium]